MTVYCNKFLSIPTCFLRTILFTAKNIGLGEEEEGEKGGLNEEDVNGGFTDNTIKQKDFF